MKDEKLIIGKKELVKANKLISAKDREIAELEEKLANAKNENIDKAKKLNETTIKLRDDPKLCGNTEEEKIKNVNFWQGYIEACLNIIDENSILVPELKSALIAMKKETKTG